MQGASTPASQRSGARCQRRGQRPVSVTSRATPTTSTLHPCSQVASTASASKATTVLADRGLEVGPLPRAEDDLAVEEAVVDGEDGGHRADGHRHAAQMGGVQELEALLCNEDFEPLPVGQHRSQFGLRRPLAGRGEMPQSLAVRTCR